MRVRGSSASVLQKRPRPADVIAYVEDTQHVESLQADGFIAVIVRSGGDKPRYRGAQPFR
jgi:hypothetical protein